MTGGVLCGMISALPMYGQYWLNACSVTSPTSAQSFLHVYHQPSYLQSSSGSVTRALWQAEMEARRSLHQSVGYHQLKSVEGYEDPTEVKRLALGKTLTIQDVVNAFKSVFTAGDGSYTLASAETETTTEKTDKKTPLDSFPWKTPLPVSPYSPLAGFVLIVEKEERKSRRQQECRELSRRQQELIRRREELEKQLARAQENYEQKLLGEGQKLEAYEKAQAERQALELRLGEAGLTEEERRNLQTELEKARQAEERARQAYEEAKEEREQAEREKNELEAQVRDINESLKLVQQRRAELVPEDFREVLEMLQEGEDGEGRGSQSGNDSSSPSGSNSSPSGGSGSSSPSSSPSGENSSEKKNWWQSIASAVGNAFNSMVQAASTAGAYIAQQASSAVNNLFRGNKSEGSGGGGSRQRVNSDVYNQGWENARKQWTKDGGKKPINEYGEKALKQAEYDRSMGKLREIAEREKKKAEVTKLEGGEQNPLRDYQDMVNEAKREMEIEDRIDGLLSRAKRGDTEALQGLIEQTNSVMDGRATDQIIAQEFKDKIRDMLGNKVSTHQGLQKAILNEETLGKMDFGVREKILDKVISRQEEMLKRERTVTQDDNPYRRQYLGANGGIPNLRRTQTSERLDELYQLRLFSLEREIGECEGNPYRQAWLKDQMGEVYKKQLKNFVVEGDNYVATLGRGNNRLTVKMSIGDFAAPVADNVNTWTGNTPINKAIERVNARTLKVTFDVMRSVNVNSIQVSSLWRNQEGSPHRSGRGMDITLATRGNTTVRFNNTNGEPPNEQKALRDEIYDAFVNDARVNQALEPWEFYGYGAKPERHVNPWKKENLTSGDYWQHRHHLHITIE